MTISAIEIRFDTRTRQNEVIIDGVSQGYFDLPEITIDNSPHITFRRPAETKA
jgi:hypothetical protein